MSRGANIPSSESRVADEGQSAMDRMISLDWWVTHKGMARGRIADCRMAVEAVPDAGAAGLALLVARVNRDLDHAEALLADPDGFMGDEWGELAPEVSLEQVSLIINRARRLLKAAASRTRNARDLLRIGVALRRIERLAARIGPRAPRRLGLMPRRAPAATPSASLVAIVATRPAHGPPLLPA